MSTSERIHELYHNAAAGRRDTYWNIQIRTVVIAAEVIDTHRVTVWFQHDEDITTNFTTTAYDAPADFRDAITSWVGKMKTKHQY